MDQVADACDERGGARDATTTSPSSSSAAAADGYRVLDRRSSVHQIMGGGKAADVLLWRRQRVSFGLVIVSTVAWIVFEQSGISFLTVCSDVLLIIIVMSFLRANYASYRNSQLQVIPELVLSEEMVNSAAASLRVKINYVLLLAHDITLGKDFRLFFKVVVFLWLFSVLGSYVSFFTVSYVGTIISITVPALYSRFREPIDKCCGVLQRQFSKHYKVVDDNVMGRIPRGLPKDKDT
uniref:Reticulon-like protein n=1 Tax=Kalanchoe fedtschenkoi TaxID=63787 RepID=A0A7N0THF6_KALFE